MFFLRKPSLVAMISKGYKVPKTIISSLGENGWEKSENDIILPVLTLRLPAPQAIVERIGAVVSVPLTDVLA